MKSREIERMIFFEHESLRKISNHFANEASKELKKVLNSLTFESLFVTLRIVTPENKKLST